MILKNFWAHRRQNGFVFVEIALIAVLSFYLIDHITVWAYGRYFCQADGEFEKEHLLVGQTARLTPITTEADSARQESSEEASIRIMSAEEYPKVMASLFAFCDEVRALPEVQSVCLTHEFIGDGTGSWRFETMGLTAVAGASPSAESLSRETTPGSVVISRSLALQLFGTADVVGRRVVDIDYKPGPDGMDIQQTTHRTVAGVVEDVKPVEYERFHYIAFYPYSVLASKTPRMLIRLKPEADAGEFIAKHAQTVTTGTYAFASLMVYKDYLEKNVRTSDQYIILTLLGTLGLLFALNVVLGTLGTFWLQIRKRTEDIGIMRSFGAKRRHLFWMIWGLHRGTVHLAAVCRQQRSGRRWRPCHLPARKRLGEHLLAALPHRLRRAVPPAARHRHHRHLRAHAPRHVQAARRGPAP